MLSINTVFTATFFPDIRRVDGIFTIFTSLQWCRKEMRSDHHDFRGSEKCIDHRLAFTLKGPKFVHRCHLKELGKGLQLEFLLKPDFHFSAVRTWSMLKPAQDDLETRKGVDLTEKQNIHKFVLG